MDNLKYKNRRMSILVIGDKGPQPEIIFDCGIFADGSKSVSINVKGQTGDIGDRAILEAIEKFLAEN